MADSHRAPRPSTGSPASRAIAPEDVPAPGSPHGAIAADREATGVTGRTARARLSLPIILDAGLLLIHRDGVTALSMRQLGRELGVEAMALYRYVPNHQALVDALVDRVVDDLLDSPDMAMPPELGWREFLSRHAHGLRALALAQPNMFPLIATHPPQAPWVRPPLRSLRWVEDFLEGLLSRGFAEQGAIAAYRTFSSFLLGHLLLEVSALGVPVGPAEPESKESETSPGGPVHDPDLSQFPALTRLAGQMGDFDHNAEFQAALTGLLDRLEHLNGLPSPSALGFAPS